MPPPIGYWIIDSDQQPEFAWNDPNPVDARAIDRIVYGESHNHFNQISLNFRSTLARCCTKPLDMQLTYVNISKQKHEYLEYNYKILSNSLARLLRRQLGVYQDIPLARDPIRNVALIDAQEQATFLDLATLIDILTLRERIAGRSPAFEGIRLVKERI